MNILEKYRALPSKHQLGIAAGLFIVLLFVLPSTIVFALGAIASYKLIDKRSWKYTAVGVLSVLTFFAGILWIAGDAQPTTVSTPVQQTQEQSHETTQQEDVASTTTEQTVAETENVLETSSQSTATTQESTPKPETPQVQSTTSAAYNVVDVVDGDTVKLNFNGTVETVRLIGIDTPETVHPTKPVECFGIEASNKAKAVLTGKTVTFETDASQGTRDKYGRLLGYIILSDGTNFNKMMIEQGYAYEYTYSTPYKYQSAFKTAEQNARASGVGLWAEGVCAGQSATPDTTTSSGKWYVSSHYSSKYYYCEESDGWKSLSEKYLKIYDTEAALLADFPDHTLHESCQ